MALPTVNPIDSGWFNAGTPIDHLGTATFECCACGMQRLAEQFKVVVGSVGGFGAPFFLAPFMKHRSTVGKFGGQRGVFTQCCTCLSLWSADDGARKALARLGLDEDGLISEAGAAAILYRSIGPEQDSDVVKIRKLPPD